MESRNVIEHPEKTILFTDVRTGKVIDISSGTEKLHGYRQQEAVGRHISEFEADIGPGEVTWSKFVDTLRSNPAGLYRQCYHTRKTGGNIIVSSEAKVGLLGKDEVVFSTADSTISKNKSATYLPALFEFVNSNQYGDKCLPIFSPQMIAVYDDIFLLAGLNVNVHLMGETGTGKTGIAHFLHFLSKMIGKKNGEFVNANVSAIPDTLLISELFGHEPGAYTGAGTKSKKGLFEEAQNGTFFLDEIGELSMEGQVKLLKVLDNRKIRHLGGMVEIPLQNMQFVSATNKSLEEEVRQNGFRRDLYYRLNTFEIKVPSLREQKGYISEIADHFLGEMSIEKAKKSDSERVVQFSQDAYDLMAAYAWPGNIRELKNAVTRGVIRTKTNTVTAKDLRLEEVISSSRIAVLNAPIEQRIDLIRDALEKTHGNRGKAAKKLGITRKTLYSHMKNNNISVEEE